LNSLELEGIHEMSHQNEALKRANEELKRRSNQAFEDAQKKIEVQGDAKVQLEKTTVEHEKAKENHDEEIKKLKDMLLKERAVHEDILRNVSHTTAQLKASLEDVHSENDRMREQGENEKAILEARLDVETSARCAAENLNDALRDEFEIELGYYQEAKENAEAELAKERAAADSQRRTSDLRQSRIENDVDQAQQRENQLRDLLRAMESQIANERRAGASNLEAARAKLRDHEMTIANLQDAQNRFNRKAEAAALNGRTDKTRADDLAKELVEERVKREVDEAELNALKEEILELKGKVAVDPTDDETMVGLRNRQQNMEEEHRRSCEELLARVDQLESELTFQTTLAEETHKELDHARAARENILLELATEKQNAVLDHARTSRSHEF